MDKLEEKIEELIYCYLGPAIDEYDDWTVINTAKEIVKYLEKNKKVINDLKNHTWYGTSRG